MKRNYLFLPTLFGIIIAALMQGCSSMNSLTIPVTEPAPVYLSPTIRSVGIINRSIPSEENRKADDLDKILSIEGKNFDRDGARAAVMGLYDELRKNDRFYDLKIIETDNIKNPGLSVFPAPLTWDQIAALCQEHDVDAIFALSFYDTDARVDYGANPVEINGPLGVKIPAVETMVTINTIIKSGWRIYDPVAEVIQDEFILNDGQVSSGRGINPLNAYQAIAGRKEAVMQISTYMGSAYAMRILPYRRRVNREYFVKGTDNFVVGKRRAQTGNWDGAAELWERETMNHKAKIAGRAYYNMAIINEINGNLDDAINWASQAYSDYGNRPALSYIRLLRGRINRNEQLRQQLEYTRQ